MTSVERDAILFAGVVRCGLCGRAGFPVDAGWLGDGLIIATYAAPCCHLRGGMVVMSPGVFPAGPEADWSRHVPGRRCAGRNRKGQPCRSYAQAGSDYCYAYRAASPAGKPP